MKKLVFCLFLVGLIAAVAFSGGGRQQAEDTMPSVVLLTDASGIDDRSFNAAAWRGILEFYGDTWANQRQRGRYYETVTAATMDMYIPMLRQAVDEGWDLVVATGFTWTDALRTVAGQNPSQDFLIVDVAGMGLPNVMEATFYEHEGSFLVGVAAALKAQADGITNPVFGFIGGVPGPVITRFHVGYVQGVLHILPNARFVDYYANSWGRPDLAMTQARHWFDHEGVFIIYSAAGGTGSGTIAQAREQRLAGRNVWAIGVDSDQHDDGIYRGTSSAVLTSMLKQVEASLLHALKAKNDNSFRGEHVRFGLATDGVGFATTNPALTPDIVRRVNAVRDDIIAGRVRVAATHADARRIPGFPQDLRALD